MSETVTIMKRCMMIKLPLLIMFWFMLSACLYSLIAKLIRMNREGEMTYFKCSGVSQMTCNLSRDGRESVTVMC